MPRALVLLLSHTLKLVLNNSSLINELVKKGFLSHALLPTLCKINSYVGVIVVRLVFPEIYLIYFHHPLARQLLEIIIKSMSYSPSTFVSAPLLMILQFYY